MTGFGTAPDLDALHHGRLLSRSDRYALPVHVLVAERASLQSCSLAVPQGSVPGTRLQQEMVLLDAATKQLDVAFVEREILPTLARARCPRARASGRPGHLAGGASSEDQAAETAEACSQRADALTLLHFNDVYNCKAPKKKKAERRTRPSRLKAAWPPLPQKQ